MTFRTLYAQEDREYGGMGLSFFERAPAGSNAFTEGRTLAHDIVEHQNGLKAIGSIGDELEAMGGIWHARGRWGDMSRSNFGGMFSAEQNIGSDLMNMARLYYDDVPLRRKVPTTREHYQDDAFMEAIRYGKDLLRKEFDGDIPADPEYWDACLHFMRTGYMKAVKRFGDQAFSNSMFWNIAQAIDETVRFEHLQGYERFRLEYTANDVRFWEVHEEEYY